MPRPPVALLAAPGARRRRSPARVRALAQSPSTRTLSFKELERGATFVHIRNTKTKYERANLAGDLLAFTNPLADASGRSSASSP